MENFQMPGSEEVDGAPLPQETADNTREIENRASFLSRLEGLPQEIIDTIDFAYDLGKEAHRPQLREGGERYFEHARNVALILMDECGIKDPDLIIASLLHDTVEDTPIFGNSTLPFSQWTKTAFFRISKIFGPEVAQTVIDLTKPKADGKELKDKKEAFALYIKNLSAASSKTLLVKMADRLHNLRTLGATPPDKQARKIAETKEVYLPIFQRVLEDYPVEGRRLLDEMDKAMAELENAGK